MSWRPATLLLGATAALSSPAAIAQDHHGAPPPAAAGNPAGVGMAGSGPGNGGRNSYANPTAVIAAELALARDAQTRGQWTAFAAAAAPDAVMFIPAMVWAQRWLKGRANPAVSVKRQPQRLWASCDGSLVVSRGTWQGPRGIGYFTTVWERQTDGAYRWVFDHADTLAQALPAPEMLTALVADCPDRPRPAATLAGAPPAPSAAGKPGQHRHRAHKRIKLADLPPLDPAHRAGAAADGSVKWDVAVDADGGRVLSVTWLKDSGTRSILFDTVAASGPGGQGG